MVSLLTQIWRIDGFDKFAAGHRGHDHCDSELQFPRTNFRKRIDAGEPEPAMQHQLKQMSISIEYTRDNSKTKFFTNNLDTDHNRRQPRKLYNKFWIYSFFPQFTTLFELNAQRKQLRRQSCGTCAVCHPKILWKNNLKLNYNIDYIPKQNNQESKNCF